MKVHKSSSKWLGPLGNCELCERSLEDFTKFYNAKTYHDLWAIMCPDCYALCGIGIGIGKGQEFSIDTRLKLRG